MIVKENGNGRIKEKEKGPASGAPTSSHGFGDLNARHPAFDGDRPRLRDRQLH
jgi:hypothetical protein